MKISIPKELKIIVHIEPDGGFWAEFPDLPGCYTQGDNLSLLTSQIQDALLTYYDVPKEEANRFWTTFTLSGEGTLKFQPAKT